MYSNQSSYAKCQHLYTMWLNHSWHTELKPTDFSHIKKLPPSFWDCYQTGNKILTNPALCYQQLCTPNLWSSPSIFPFHWLGAHKPWLTSMSIYLEKNGFTEVCWNIQWFCVFLTHFKPEHFLTSTSYNDIYPYLEIILNCFFCIIFSKKCLSYRLIKVTACWVISQVTMTNRKFGLCAFKNQLNLPRNLYSLLKYDDLQVLLKNCYSTDKLLSRQMPYQ